MFNNIHSRRQEEQGGYWRAGADVAKWLAHRRAVDELVAATNLSAIPKAERPNPQNRMNRLKRRQAKERKAKAKRQTRKRGKR